jgi:DNA-binding response OmpR family regulator
MNDARRTPAGGTPLSASDLAPAALGGGRVLVVDRGPDAAAALTALLRLNGFAAHAASTGAAALRATLADRPDVIVIDLDLPDVDPCAVIRRIRAIPNPPHVVVLTGYTDTGHRRAAAEAGACEYLFKPAEPSDLVRLLMRLCHPTGD